MPTYRRLAFAALPILPAVCLAVACVSSSDDKGTPGPDGGTGVDGARGNDSGGVPVPASDSGGPTSDSGGPVNDGGVTPGDGGGTGPFTQCESLVNLAELANYASLALGTSGDQQFVAYGTMQTDGGTAVAVRAFDGTNWLPEVNVGSTQNMMFPTVVSDSAGHAWVMLMDQYFQSARFLYDYSARTTTAIEATPSWSIAAVGTGEAMSLYADSSRVLHADRWFADGGIAPTGLSAPAAWDMALQSNGQGAVVAKWSDNPSGSKVNGVAAAGASAGTWGSTGETDAGAGYSVAQVAHAVLSNGDAVFMIGGTSLQVGVFHVATGAFGPLTTLDPSAAHFQEGPAEHWIVADAHDHVTIGWWDDVPGGHLYTSRSLNAGVDWSAPADLGGGENLRLVVDRASDRTVVATIDSSAPDWAIALRSAGPTDTKWSQPYTTNMSAVLFGYNVQLAFTSKGLRIVSAVSNPDGGPQDYLETTVCN